MFYFMFCVEKNTYEPITDSWSCETDSVSSFIVFPLKLIVECEQVKTERETELISEQVLIAMSEMGLDRERTIQVRRTLLDQFHC